MQKTKLGTIAALIATIALSWSAGADAKPDRDTCSGGSANAAQCDLDGDGVVNKDDDDIDGDGIADDADVCPRDSTDQCESDEDPGPDPTGGLPGLDDLPGLEDLPPVEPPSDVPPDGVPPVEVPPVTLPTVPDVPPVPPVA